MRRLVEDEGFEQHFPLRACDRFKNAGIELLAILEQGKFVATNPSLAQSASFLDSH
jgi:hypothetical protein